MTLDAPEKLTIDTPEQVALEFPLSGIGSRFLAVAFDSMVQVIGFLALGLIGALALPHHFAWLAILDKWAAAALIFIAFSLYWGYYAFFEAFWKGQTPGKRLAHIRVIKENGRPINTFEAVARNLMRAVDQIPFFYGVGVITMWLNQRHRRLGDFVAGTVVVHETKETEDTGIISQQSEVRAPLAVSGFSVQELEVIETFLGRRLDLPLDVRRNTAGRLADLFAARLSLSPEQRGKDEDFLERLAVQIRNSHRYRQAE
ncbi:MAG: RDD family protein [Terriglobales bacterium]|jgi:uncharacterized RDD family membrane protein YckC